MTAPKWILASLFALSSFVTIAQIGKPRTPGSPLTAAIVVALNAVMIWLVVIA